RRVSTCQRNQRFGSHAPQRGSSDQRRHVRPDAWLVGDRPASVDDGLRTHSQTDRLDARGSTAMTESGPCQDTSSSRLPSTLKAESRFAPRMSLSKPISTEQLLYLS